MPFFLKTIDLDYGNWLIANCPSRSSDKIRWKNL